MSQQFIVVFLLLLSSVAQAGVTPFKSASKEGAEFEGRFCWTGPKGRFVFGARGDISSSRQKQAVVSLPLEQGEYIELLWVLPHQSSVFVAYETFDGEGGRGAVCRFNENFTRQMWCQKIQGFNVYAGLSDAVELYVASIGFVGRINVKSGAYIWQQHGLYERDEAFNMIGKAEEEANKIKFYASSGMGSGGKYISLQRDSGKILEIGDAKAVQSGVRMQPAAGGCPSGDE